MKLIFKGHDCKYAAEQIMMSVLPDTRPEYGAVEDGEDYARISFKRTEKNATASVMLRYRGETAHGIARVSAEKLANKLRTDSETQRIIKLAFYRAAVKVLPKEPVWGAVTGIRPGTLMTRMLEAGVSEKAAVNRMQREYYVSRERALLCADTSRASMRVKKSIRENDVALYIGIPFCPTRCAYCSFVSQSVEKSMALIPPFLEVLKREIAELGRIVRELGLTLTAVYIGGGTPTTLTAVQMDELMDAIQSTFDMSAVREFSVEAGRPDTITEDKLIAIRNGGATRISINPQSMDDTVLAAIGRRHSAAAVEEAYGLARRVMDVDINMDLIAGLPADTPESFLKTLRKVISMEPENITVHTLALKKGTKITLEGAQLPSADQVAEMLDTAGELLRKAGYTPYYLYRQKFMSGGFENIGWAKEGKESYYNILIMEELGTILAAGGGASTKLVDTATGRVERIFDFKYPKEYIEGEEKMMKAKGKISRFYRPEKSSGESEF